MSILYDIQCFWVVPEVYGVLRIVPQGHLGSVGTLQSTGHHGATFSSLASLPLPQILESVIDKLDVGVAISVDVFPW